MKRCVTAGLLVLALGAGTVFADVLTGKIEKIDVEKNSLTVKADGKSRPLPVEKDAAIFYKPVGKKKGVDVTDGVKGLKQGQEVTVWTETKGGKEVITQVRIESAGGTVKKKKDK